jgi:hypothetical protein
MEGKSCQEFNFPRSPQNDEPGIRVASSGNKGRPRLSNTICWLKILRYWAEKQGARLEHKRTVDIGMLRPDIQREAKMLVLPSPIDYVI